MAQEHDVSHWDQGWSTLNNVPLENKIALQNVMQSSYWLKIQQFVEDQYGSINGINVIEVGCGRGLVSAAMATQGAEVTLVDLSKAALTCAEEFYANHGLASPTCVLADAFHIPDRLLGQFEVACSFGLVEHFRGQERVEIFETHASLLRPRGCAIISAPNRLYLPSQIYQFIAKRLDVWPYGYEKDFTPRELLRYGQIAGLVDCSVIGSEVIYDLYRHIFLKLPAFFGQIVRRRTQGPVTAEYGESGKYTLSARAKRTIVTSPLDSLLGFILVLLAHKS